ncbi:MAG TPA: hypothetical protein VLC54_16135, partial [Anaeromyxobacter sp.]|nr:hypothetical protein [Anaeromyxobacter sp.]
GGAYWWVVPLIGLVFMGVMLFACLRGFGCMGARRRRFEDDESLRREVEGLKEDVRKLRRNPS